MLSSNPWELLGVRPGSTVEDLNRSFRRKIFECHPDRGGPEDKSKVLVEAFEYLKERVVNGRLVFDPVIPEPVVVHDGVMVEILLNVSGAGWWFDLTSTNGTGSW